MFVVTVLLIGSNPDVQRTPRGTNEHRIFSWHPDDVIRFRSLLPLARNCLVTACWSYFSAERVNQDLGLYISFHCFRELPRLVHYSTMLPCKAWSSPLAVEAILSGRALSTPTGKSRPVPCNLSTGRRKWCPIFFSFVEVNHALLSRFFPMQWVPFSIPVIDMTRFIYARSLHVKSSNPQKINSLPALVLLTFKFWPLRIQSSVCAEITSPVMSGSSFRKQRNPTSVSHFLRRSETGFNGIMAFSSSFNFRQGPF